ncbi:MAG TPA: LuxR C-terminal-related transcriptional regulator [Anaerolineales bacterium]|nr:LuxR C-terminal-related transcriptional regulator [Anaerolineales bacterium]
MSTPIPLLATKLRIPPTGSTLIPRPQLLEKLNEGLRLGRRMTLISAPAGYGKTTLLSYWVHHCQRAVAWLSLDEEDSDPARFLAYLVAALRQIEVVAGDTVSASLATLQPFSAQAVLPTLINAIATGGRVFVLILDDYHLIQASPVHDALTYLLDHQPPQVHLVIASRADPPLPLARLRARGQLAELRQSDLRFTPDETTAFLNQVMGLGLEAGDVAVLASRTEGWIAGLHLAATSIQARGDAHRFIQDFKGSNRYILDYLIEEVLRRQSQNVQAFLLQTSILDRLTGSLCDAVTEQGGGQAMLERLERANLFIVPLDDERTWYRYHRLFADLLLKRLGETHPELAPTLHQRASAWHEQNGLMAEAIDHALAAKDFERAAGLIERIAEATLMRSESATLLKWINALPEAHVRAQPSLCVYHAWVLLLGGSPLEAVEARLEQAEGQPTLLTLPLRALVANYRGDVTGAIELSQRALEQLPETEALMRGLAALNLAAAYHTQGDLAASQRVLQEAALGSHQTGNVMMAVAVLCYRAELCRREGKLRQARSLYQQAVDLATEKRGDRLPIAGRALIGLAEMAREWNELDTATHCIFEGIELAGRWAQADALGAHLALARIRQAQGDWDGVHEALQAMRQVAMEFKATEADDRLVDMAEAWMQIAQGNLDGPRRWAERYGLTGTVDPMTLEKDDDLIVRRLRKYEYAILARLWMAEGCPAEALALLESALPIAEKMKRIGLVIEYEILIALAAQALGQTGKAMQALERAMTLAEPEGFVRIFVDEGKPMARLLYEAASQRTKPEYAGRLLAAFPIATPSRPKHAEMIEPLSARELEVLRLIAEGLSNEEIAQRLVLSLPTVKWHTGNIYGKLSVKNRTEAVAKARSLGLLPLA